MRIRKIDTVNNVSNIKNLVFGKTELFFNLPKILEMRGFYKFYRFINIYMYRYMLFALKIINVMTYFWRRTIPRVTLLGCICCTLMSSRHINERCNETSYSYLKINTMLYKYRRNL